MIYCAAAGAIAVVGVVAGLVLLALGSRHGMILTWIWSCLPAAGLAIGAWAWVPAMAVITFVGGFGLFPGRGGDLLFVILYHGSPVVGLIAGIGAAALISRRYGGRRQPNIPVPPDASQPPDPGDIWRIVGDSRGAMTPR